MGAFLSTIMTWVIGSNLAKLFTGIGVAVVSQIFLTGYVDSALTAITSQMGSLSSDVGNLFKMLGFGQFLSIIGSAFLTRVTIMQASKTFGITVST